MALLFQDFLFCFVSLFFPFVPSFFFPDAITSSFKKNMDQRGGLHGG